MVALAAHNGVGGKEAADRGLVAISAARPFGAASRCSPLPLVDARHAAVELGRVEQAIVLDDGARNPMKLAVADIAATT